MCEGKFFFPICVQIDNRNSPVSSPYLPSILFLAPETVSIPVLQPIKHGVSYFLGLATNGTLSCQLLQTIFTVRCRSAFSLLQHSNSSPSKQREKNDTPKIFFTQASINWRVFWPLFRHKLAYKIIALMAIEWVNMCYVYMQQTKDR